MMVSRPVHGGLLVTWGNAGRPPMPRRAHSGWSLITLGKPNPSTVIDSEAYEADAKFTMDPPARHYAPGDPFSGYHRFCLDMFGNETTKQVGPFTITSWEHVHTVPRRKQATA